MRMLVKLQAASSPLHPDRGLKHIQKARNNSSSAPVTSLSALCLILWTSACMCLNALFNRASTHILRASYFADIGITTDKTSNISCTCVALALVAGRRDSASPYLISLALPVSNRRHYCCHVSFSVSEPTLHDCKYSLRDAFQCIAQPNTTLLDCMLYLMQYPYDQAFYQALQISVSLGKCV